LTTGIVAHISYKVSAGKVTSSWERRP